MFGTCHFSEKKNKTSRVPASKRFRCHSCGGHLRLGLVRNLVTEVPKVGSRASKICWNFKSRNNCFPSSCAASPYDV